MAKRTTKLDAGQQARIHEVVEMPKCMKCHKLLLADDRILEARGGTGYLNVACVNDHVGVKYPLTKEQVAHIIGSGSLKDCSATSGTVFR